MSFFRFLGFFLAVSATPPSSKKPKVSGCFWLPPGPQTPMLPNIAHIIPTPGISVMQLFRGGGVPIVYWGVLFGICLLLMTMRRNKRRCVGSLFVCKTVHRKPLKRVAKVSLVIKTYNYCTILLFSSSQWWESHQVFSHGDWYCKPSGKEWWKIAETMPKIVENCRKTDVLF